MKKSQIFHFVLPFFVLKVTDFVSVKYPILEFCRYLILEMGKYTILEQFEAVERGNEEGFVGYECEWENRELL